MVREVAAGGGVTIVFQARASELATADVAVRPLAPSLSGELARAHRRGYANALLPRAVDAVGLAARAAQRAARP